MRDLGSKNGLVVNGARRTDTVLEPGVEVGLGRGILYVEEADTSDIELAVRIDAAGPAQHEPRRKDPTETGTEEEPPVQPSARHILRFVRECEDARARGETDPTWIFAKAAPLLHATGLYLWQSTGDGVVTVTAAWGLPQQRMECSDGCTVTWRFRERARFRTSRDAGLSVSFSTAAEAAEQWRADLVGYLGNLLAGVTPRLSDRQAAAPTDRSLALPTNMVAGCSPAMRDLFTQLRAAAGSTIDVLLTGETGTGKELIARTLHASSGRPGPLVIVNCAAIPAELLEAELFGVHGRIATGVDPRPGRLLLAESGTVFLDEIGELAGSLQAKILRFLQEREVHAIGAPAPKRVDLRVIAATNRDLREEVRFGRFRADLFYRLRGLELNVPPLRERKEDIPEMSLAFIRRASVAAGKEVRGITRKALAALLEHDWPGNVRELEADVRRAVLLCPDGGSVGAEHLPARGERQPALRVEAGPIAAREPSLSLEADAGTLSEQLDAKERSIFARVLAETRGNKAEAARKLGIKRTTFVMRLKKLARSEPRRGES